jgi:hypothetical protein
MHVNAPSKTGHLVTGSERARPAQLLPFAQSSQSILHAPRRDFDRLYKAIVGGQEATFLRRYVELIFRRDTVARAHWPSRWSRIAQEATRR